MTYLQYKFKLTGISPKSSRKSPTPGTGVSPASSMQWSRRSDGAIGVVRVTDWWSPQSCISPTLPTSNLAVGTPFLRSQALRQLDTGGKGEKLGLLLGSSGSRPFIVRTG